MQVSESSRQRCSGTRKDGQPCDARAIDAGLCAAHSGRAFGGDPTAAARLSAEARRVNRERRRKHAERRDMTLAEALRERAAQERDALVDALFAPLSQSDPITAHKAAVTILERMLGRPAEGLAVEQPEPEREMTRDDLIQAWAAIDADECSDHSHN
jgi:hypothetical protein